MQQIEQTNQNKSLVGKIYYPFDNSYLLNLTAGKRISLAGLSVSTAPPKETIIVRDPYKFKVITNTVSPEDILEESLHEHTFVDVKYQACIYRVLFNENRFNLTKEEVMQKHADTCNWFKNY